MLQNVQIPALAKLRFLSMWVCTTTKIQQNLLIPKQKFNWIATFKSSRLLTNIVLNECWSYLAV